MTEPEDDELVRFGDEIRAFRKAREMTVADLAGRVDSTPAIISRLERGLYNPSLKFLPRLTVAIGPDAVPVLFPRVKSRFASRRYPRAGSS